MFLLGRSLIDAGRLLDIEREFRFGLVPVDGASWQMFLEPGPGRRGERERWARERTHAYMQTVRLDRIDPLHPAFAAQLNLSRTAR